MCFGDEWKGFKTSYNRRAGSSRFIQDEREKILLFRIKIQGRAWNVTFFRLCDLVHLVFWIQIFSKKEVSPAWARGATLEEDGYCQSPVVNNPSHILLEISVEGFSYESSKSLIKEEKFISMSIQNLLCKTFSLCTARMICRERRT